MIQESRRQYQREGFDYSYGDLERMALEEKPFTCFIDPDDPSFVPPKLPRRVREFCEKTGQPVPERWARSCAAFMRAWPRNTTTPRPAEKLHRQELPGRPHDRRRHQDNLLCRMTANACGCEVTAGPIEATVLGNIAMQPHCQRTDSQRRRGPGDYRPLGKGAALPAGGSEKL